MLPIKHLTLCALGTSLLFPLISLAEPMQGTTYRISRDSVAAGGGVSSSGLYQSQDMIGEVVVGDGVSEQYQSKAGHIETLESYVAVSSVAPVVMDTPLGGLSGGESNGTALVTVTTDNPAGYQLMVSAATIPAMQAADAALANYVPAGAADFLFQTGIADAHFGYSVYGTDVVSDFRHDGANCGVGSQNDRGRCWVGFATSTTMVAEASSSNHPVGTATEVQYRVGIGTQQVQLPGTYVATTTITVIPK